MTNFHTFSGNKKGMVSSGLYIGGSGKPTTLSTTAKSAVDGSTKPRADAQRPTPDRCECSSYSWVVRSSPVKNLPDFPI